MEALFATRGVQFLDFLQYPDVELTSRRTTFICGPSGCGKSTLLRLFNGMVSPSTGTVLYNGEDIAALDAVSLRREALLCPQDVYLFDGSIANSFFEYLRFRELPKPSSDTIERLLNICAATLSIESDVNTLSGGERQRVFIAICLALEPKVLLLDEPTSALDHATAFALLSNLKSYATEHDMTLIAVSHDAELAAAYADDIITLSGERILNAGDAQ